MDKFLKTHRLPKLTQEAIKHLNRPAISRETELLLHLRHVYDTALKGNKGSICAALRWFSGKLCWVETADLKNKSGCIYRLLLESHHYRDREQVRDARGSAWGTVWEGASQ